MEFEDIFLFDSNDENSFGNSNNSNNSSPSINENEITFDDFLSMPSETNNNNFNNNNNNNNNTLLGKSSFLMSSNFFSDTVKNEIELKNEGIFQSYNNNNNFNNNNNNNNSNNNLSTFPLINETITTDSNTTDEPKKRRGRPKKVQNTETTKNIEQKKRGRPKMNKANANSNSNSNSNSDDEDISYVEDSTEKNKKSKVESQIQKKDLLKVPTTGNAFNFTSMEVRQMNSEEFENYCEQVKKQRPLTDEEENQYRKQNRVIRNRESAQRSRLKKRMHVDKLEKKISQLESQIDFLQNKNVEYLNQINSLSDRNVRLEELLKRYENGQGSNTPKFDMKKGVFLFMIVFSFGLFFRFNFFPQNQQLGLPMNPFNTQQQHNFGHNRGLLAKDLPDNSLSLTNPPHLQPQKIPPQKIPPQQIPPQNNQRTKIGILNTSEQQSTTKSNHYFNRKHDKELVISANDALVKQHSHDVLSDETSYIYCSEAKRVSKGSSTKSPVVGFLVPSDFLNDTNLIPQYQNQRPPLVEITCNVMEVFPIFPLPEKS